jgi:hypothetical protein
VAVLFSRLSHLNSRRFSIFQFLAEEKEKEIATMKRVKARRVMMKVEEKKETISC